MNDLNEKLMMIDPKNYTPLSGQTKENTACFTGHRSLTPSDLETISKTLVPKLHELYNAGIKHFVTGGALGFDSIAALSVLELRQEMNDVTLTVAVPHIGQERSWSIKNRRLYEEILDKADAAVCLSQHYFAGCMALRNRFMVDLSRVCVGYLTSDAGGTAGTLKYATKSGCETVNLAAPQMKLFD